MNKEKILKLIGLQKKRSFIMNECNITKTQYQKVYAQFRKKREGTKKCTAIRGVDYGEYENNNFTEEFLYKMNKLVGKSGCYLIYTRESKLVYIGQSLSVGVRVRESMEERKNYAGVKIIECSPSDMFTLEMLLINKYKPIFNKQGKGEGESTFSVPTHYDPFNFSIIWN